MPKQHRSESVIVGLHKANPNTFKRKSLFLRGKVALRSLNQLCWLKSGTNLLDAEDKQTQSADEQRMHKAGKRCKEKLH